MDFNMILQMAFRLKRLHAVWHITFIRSLPCMNPHVDLQIALLVESFVTHFAGEWFVS